MAKTWSDEEKAELADLVRLLYGIAPVRTWAQFAEIAGVHPVSLSRWQQGKDAPEGYNVLRLLKASGGLDLLRAAADRKATAGQPAVRGGIEEAVVEMSRRLEAMAETVARIDNRLAEDPHAGDESISQPAPTGTGRPR